MEDIGGDSSSLPSPLTPPTMGIIRNNSTDPTSNKRPCERPCKRPCEVCGDLGTGNHYGAYTCYGCKGFFQRTIRKGVLYVCRYSRNCSITKNKRNQCRYCRFSQCLQRGMKREAVQDERDKIKNKKKSSYSIDSEDITTFHSAPISMSLLFQADNEALRISRTNYPGVIPKTIANPEILPVTEPTLHQIFEGLKLQFHYELEWAKQIPVFRELSLEGQLALLKAHTGELCVLSLARRSMNANNSLITINGFKVMAKEVRSDTLVRFRTIEEILKPCQILKTQDSEFLCLKALTLFDPDTPYLTVDDKKKIAAIRAQLTILLENSVDGHNHQGRIGNLLLLLPKVYSIGQQFIILVRQFKTKTAAQLKMPRLIEEIMLGGGSNNGHSHNPNQSAMVPYNNNQSPVTLNHQEVPEGTMTISPPYPTNSHTSSPPHPFNVQMQVHNGTYHNSNTDYMMPMEHDILPEIDCDLARYQTKLPC